MSDPVQTHQGGRKVRDWMNLGVLTCEPDTPAETVAATMRYQDVSALVVVDGQGYALGVIPRMDLVGATFRRPGCGLRGLAARHLMSSPAISVRAEAPIEEAAQLMQARKVHRVVVTVAEGTRERPIGVLSVTDLAGRSDDRG